jgi:hypothetical protein
MLWANNVLCQAMIVIVIIAGHSTLQQFGLIASTLTTHIN